MTMTGITKRPALFDVIATEKAVETNVTVDSEAGKGKESCQLMMILIFYTVFIQN